MAAVASKRSKATFRLPAGHETASAAALFLAELRELPGCEQTKRRVLHLFETHAGARFYIARRITTHVARLDEARHLLRLGLSRGEAAQRLASHLGVSLATAYRAIAKVL